MLVTTARKKAFGNAETSKTGKNNENDKNRDKNKNLRKILHKSHISNTPSSFENNLCWCYLT